VSDSLRTVTVLVLFYCEFEGTRKRREYFTGIHVVTLQKTRAFT